MKSWHKYKAELSLIILAFASSLFFASHYLYAWDSAQLALGIQHFDLNSYQPHPPGYPLFLFLGWLFSFIFRDINFSLIFINALVSTLSALLIYKITKNLSYDNKIAFAISLILIFHPIFWHYRSVALTYSFEVLAPLLGLYFLQKINTAKQGKYFLIHTALTATLIGFRPSLIIISLPLLFFNFLLIKRKKYFGLWASVIFVILSLAWLIPLMVFSNGINNYLTILKNQYSSLTKTFTDQNLINFYYKSFIVTAGPFIILPILAGPFKKNNRLIGITTIALFCLVLIFYFFSHLGVVGYMLSLIPLVLLLSLNFWQKIFQHYFAYLIVAIIIIAEIYFFIIPVSFIKNKDINRLSYAATSEHDKRIKTYLYISKLQNPADTLIISLRGQYYDEEKKVNSYKYDDARILSSYLPQYKIYDLVGVKNLYFEAKNYRYQQRNSNQIYFDNSIKKIIILGEYLHPSSKPTGINLEGHCSALCIENYYQADISEINNFKFYGFNFIRS